VTSLLSIGVPRAAEQSASTLTRDPMVGVWMLNLAKKYSFPPPKSTTVTITPATRGYTFTIDAVGADGKPQSWSYTSAFDGVEVPASGNPMIDTVLASTDANGATVRYKKNGNVITTTSSVVSNDGKTLSVTLKVPDGKGGELISVAVYERP
jgi:hypothetical protein